MVKSIFKVFSLLSLGALLFYNVQVLRTEGGDSITLSKLKNSEVYALPPGPGEGEPPGPGLGCYVSYVLTCPLLIGDTKVCDFTGMYGPPYACTEYSCFSTTNSRRCVSAAS